MVIKILNKNSMDVIKDYLPQNITDSIYDGDVKIFAAMNDDIVNAVMVVRENKDFAQIAHISVADEYRQQGICTELICDYMWRCAEKDIVRLKCTLGDDENDKYIERILIKLGFMMEFTWNTIITASVSDFCKSDLPNVSTKGHMIMDFKELGKVGIVQAAKFIKANTSFRYSERDLMKCNKELSFVIIVNGFIKDVVLVNEYDDSLELACMYSAKDDVSGVVILLNELRKRVQNNSKYAERKVMIPIVNEASYKLVKHIISEISSESVYRMCFEFK